MLHQDLSLDPADRRRIAEIADSLRRLPCGNRLVGMELHRIARELEALVDRTTVGATRGNATTSAEQGSKKLALADHT